MFWPLKALLFQRFWACFGGVVFVSVFFTVLTRVVFVTAVFWGVRIT